ncbi:MAG TPA: hemolysin family protein [Candidatus Deferrimicrobiaceae bacterium]|nr:hemolysin family protein [Candidatus Deferrimicrobiaceae bacterium]
MNLYLAIALCLFMEGLFTGAEMVLISADRHKLADRSRRGERGATTALSLLKHPDRALATTLTGTNLFVVLGTVLTTSHFLPRYGDRAAWIAIGVITPLVILFGEVVPKSFAQPRADRLAGPAARFIWFAQGVLYPLVFVMAFLARVLSRPFGGVPPLHGMVTREELRLILQMSHPGSDVEPHERTMVRRVFHFGEKKVVDIFRPLVHVVALPETGTCRDVAALASLSGYSRYPVYRDRVDHVVGFLHVIDTVGQPPDAPIRPLMRKALYVPELMPIDELMRKFQEAGTSFAVVVDEYGGVSGIVTAEDVVEEVVGEIEDEYDRGIEYYRKTASGEFLVPGRMEVGRFEEAMGVSLPKGDYSTVGGMLISLAGRIPAEGESFTVPGAEFTVSAASERAVKEVRVRLTERPPGSPFAEDEEEGLGMEPWEGSD